MDDIIIFSKRMHERIYHVDDILTTLGEDSVMYNREMFRIFSAYVDYLGYIIKLGCLEIDQSHTKCLKDAKPSANWYSIRLFLGLCNVYRRFIPDSTGIAQLLNNLLCKGAPENF